MAWSQIMKQRMIEWLDTLPDPAYIRVAAAGKTIPFSRGVHEFPVKQDARLPNVEYLDEDGQVLATLPVRSVQRKDTIRLTIADGPFWKADMR